MLNGKIDKALKQATAEAKWGSSLVLKQAKSPAKAPRAPRQPSRTSHAPRQAPNANKPHFSTYATPRWQRNSKADKGSRHLIGPGRAQLRGRIFRGVLYASLAFGRECTCQQQPRVLKQGSDRGLGLLEREDGRVNFLYKRRDNFFVISK